MPFAVVGLIVAVALARGGYHASGILTFELGAFALLFWVIAEVLFDTADEERARLLAQRKSRATDVEIVLPGGSVHETPRSSDDYLVISGFPFKKTSLGLPLLLLTLWVAASLIPMPVGSLEWVSPQAYALRSEAARLGAASSPTAPLSVAPFLTARSLWMWCACIALMVIGAHMGARRKRVERFCQLLFLTGVGFGIYGLGQWLFGLQELLGQTTASAHLRASASFGNRNHYAAFMEMLLLCGLGWVGMHHAGLRTDARESLARRIEAGGGKLFLLGLGVVFVSLGLIFSLSRAGITFGLVGAAVYLFLRPSPAPGRGVIELRDSARPRRRVPGVIAVVLLVVGTASWIGLDPVVHRFKLLPNEWQAERDRTRVWSDALAAVPDYAVTGSGLSTFRYVFPMYRSFGGRLFYSWAHNDYLQVLIELGAPGLLLLVWIAAATFRRARWVRASLSDDPALLHLHAGFAGALIALALHSFTDFGLHLMGNAACFPSSWDWCSVSSPPRSLLNRARFVLAACGDAHHGRSTDARHDQNEARRRRQKTPASGRGAHPGAHNGAGRRDEARDTVRQKSRGYRGTLPRRRSR